MLERLSAVCFRSRRWVVVAWLVLIVGLNVIGSAAAGDPSEEFGIPGSETQRALDLMETSGFGARTGDQAQVVFHAPDGIADHQDVIDRALEEIAAGVPDSEIVSPFAPGGERQISTDGTIAYAEVNLADRDADALTTAADQIQAAGDAVASGGLAVEYGGEMFLTEGEIGGPREGLALLAAAVILLVAFGSLLAMGLPLVVGVFGAGCGIAVISLAANVVEMPGFAAPAAAMIAIGVGIDYALLVVTRYREALHDGATPADAVQTAQATAGRSVLFAGTTVVIAVLGLLTMRLGIIDGVAVGIAAAVAMTMLASLTLLPALLGFAGRNIDRFGLPHRQRRDDGRGTLAHRWSRRVQRRPLPYALGALALLLLLAVPATGMRLGFGDAGTANTDQTTRRAFDLLSDGFGPGFNGPLVLATSLDTPGQIAHLDDLTAVLADTDGIAHAGPVIPNPDGTAAIVPITPATGPQDQATTDLVHQLRDHIVPDALADTGLQPAIGGITAGAIDYADHTADRLPLFIALVLAVSFVLLMAVFRSVLVPLKAVAMNLLSIVATYGAITAVFQWGWGVDLLGLNEAAPIEAWVPMMLFAIVFGLSMDYEVFLLSRIKEEYQRTGDNAAAVADGLARTARVITAAAAIMVCVFGSFVLGSDRELKLLGFGLAFAVLIDATVVRMILVPATMELLGDRNWWLPRWLDRILPNISIEGPSNAGTVTRDAPAEFRR